MRCCIVMLLLAAFPAFAIAQGNTSDKEKAGAKDAGSEVLTPSEVTAAILQLRKDLKALGDKVTDYGSNLETVKTDVGTLKSDQATLRAELDQLQSQFSEQLALQQKILNQISAQDGEGYIPRLSANMKTSSAFKQDMTDAVHEALKSRTTGTLILNNRTNDTRQVTINRSTYLLNPRESRTFEVPVGPVTTQLAGSSMRNWTIQAPDYRLSLDVVPLADPTTVLRPASQPAPEQVSAPSLSTPVAAAPVYYYFDPFSPVYYWYP